MGKRVRGAAPPASADNEKNLPVVMHGELPPLGPCGGGCRHVPAGPPPLWRCPVHGGLHRCTGPGACWLLIGDPGPDGRPDVCAWTRTPHGYALAEEGDVHTRATGGLGTVRQSRDNNHKVRGPTVAAVLQQLLDPAVRAAGARAFWAAAATRRGKAAAPAALPAFPLHLPAPEREVLAFSDMIARCLHAKQAMRPDEFVNDVLVAVRSVVKRLDGHVVPFVPWWAWLLLPEGAKFTLKSPIGGK
jgi:hypothetical protein